MCLTRFLQSILVMFVTFTEIQSKCETTFVTTCEKITDIARYGQSNWMNLIIVSDMRNQDSAGPPDEILPERAFKNTPNLEQLYIVQKVTEVQPGAFNGLNQLTYMKLHKNILKVIQRGAFSNLTRISKMDLQDNSIENISHGLFANSKITAIDLSHNKINNIQVDMLDLPSLKKLTIAFNDITDMAPGCFHANLEYLNFDHNSLSDIREGVLKPLKNLKTLVLSHNKFQGIGLDYDLPSLEELDLSHNSIVDIQDGTFNHFLELKHLYLQYNRITRLSPNVLSNKNVIELLHLHHNGLVDLEDELAGRLVHLREISFGANPWACACLWKISSYLHQRKISQPDCDKEYFGSGLSAVCLVAFETCTGKEQLTQELYDTFIGSLKSYNCQ